jgi:hypothetical protein
MTFSWQAIMIKALVRPFALFAQEPIIQLFGAYMAYLYGIMYRQWFRGARSAAYPNLS